eukprot:CAMPEP_0172574790 /NCGR_PEP_ID=MMETSP1067-20121228/136880_1 /TAXON_ID=265564 ORGANISM="Thalassiosira punctigera, Strain Tpunct2005C2" /NCGR_SAMPLE_ID=MMETSP1067 /ASSEMBLY_ACC=CAM_ASM_000444 /LENGTH=1153 /DNA_ID=CAMNT_0013367423 /DNA_START=250 /DNA_END=3707 /DNA_ORIENTATION=+
MAARDGNDDDGRPGRKRSDGRDASNLASLRSLRSCHYLPQNYSPLAGVNEGGSPRNPGGAPSLPPPPPPPPPFQRGRNGPFHSQTGNDAGINGRGRSLSTARNSPSGGGRPRSKHGEGKEGSANEVARSRSLSLARPYSDFYPKPPPPRDVELPLIDAKGRRQPRSRSRSKSRGRQQQQGTDDGERVRRKSSTAASKASLRKKKTPVPKSPSRTAATKDLFKQVMAEEKDGGATSSSSRRPSGRGGNRGRTSSRGRRRSRSESRDGRSASRSSSKKGDCKAARADGSTSRGRKLSKSRGAEDRPLVPAAGTRKFMVEVGDDGRFLQVFEFSDSGASPSKGEPAFIENIRRKFSNPSRSSRGRSGGVCGPSRKIVVESDACDNIIQVLELPGDGVALLPTPPDAAPAAAVSKREESPFSKRVYENDRQAPACPDDFISRKTLQESSRSPSPRSASLPRTNQAPSRQMSAQSSKSRSSSLSRTSAGGALRSSLRSSLKDGSGNPAQTTVRFALDNDGNAFNTSETSFGSAGSRSSRSSGLSLKADAALNNSEESFKSTDSSDIVVRKSVSFMLDQQNDRRAGDDIASALTSYPTSDEGRLSNLPQPPVRCRTAGGSALDNSDGSFESNPTSLASSMPSDFKAAYQQGKPVLDARDHYALPQPSRKSLRGLSDISEKSDESSHISRQSSTTSFMTDQEVRERSLAHAAHAARPPQGRSAGRSALDTSDRSDDSNARRSVSFHTAYEPQLSSLGRSALDTSDRSDDSRRSASFMMHQQEQSEGRQNQAVDLKMSPNSLAYSINASPPVYPPPPPPRMAQFARANASERAPGLRRARSLSRGRDADEDAILIINDSSSLTATRNGCPASPLKTRGRFGDGAPGGRPVAPTPRQVRSLSRTRNGAVVNIGIRDVNFDPAASITSDSQGNHRETMLSQGINRETFQERRPPLEKFTVQKSMISHSTEATFISAASEDTHLTDQAIRAVELLGVDEYGDPLMNSTLTIFESECDDDDRSLLSDPTIFTELSTPGAELQQAVDGEVWQPPTASAANVGGIRVHISREESAGSGEVSREERRSRIRRMLSRKASTKRQNRKSAVAGSSSNPSLDTSEETRETFISADTDPLAQVWMEGAQESLFHHQNIATRQPYENQGSGGG